MHSHDPIATHCADETFEPGNWTLCGLPAAGHTVLAADQFDAPWTSRCDLCAAQRLIVASTVTRLSLTSSHLNTLIATSSAPLPLRWSSWPQRSGWLQAEIPGGNRSMVYELGKHISDADGSITVLVAEPGTTGRPWTLIAGPKP